MALDNKQVKTAFDLWAPTYDGTVATADWGFEHYCDGLEWICQQLGRQMTHGRLIDLGCGTGSLGERLQRRFPFIEYIGVDISPKMLQIAKAKVGSARFLQADLRDIDVWSRYLDSHPRNVVVSTYALHHFDDEEKVRVVKHAFSASKRRDLSFLIVDYAFFDAGEHDRMLNEQVTRGNEHVVEEIETESYADLSILKQALSSSGLSISLGKNGIWDWRISLWKGETPNTTSPPGQFHGESSFR